MLVFSIFSFSHNVFKKILSWDREKSGLCGKELNGGWGPCSRQKRELMPSTVHPTTYHIIED